MAVNCFAHSLVINGAILRSLNTYRVAFKTLRKRFEAHDEALEIAQKKQM